jgi:hypothetical protein
MGTIRMPEQENLDNQPQELDELPINSQATSQFDVDSETGQDERLRFLLSYLYDSKHRRIPVEELVAAVEEYEAERPETDERPIRQSIRASLVHEYFPRLSSIGVIDHSPRRGEVRFRR